MRVHVKRVEVDTVVSDGDHRDVIAEVQRRYASLQESMAAKTAALEAEIARLNGEIVAGRAAVESARTEASSVVASKDAELARLRERMEDMANEFGDMLAEAIRKMADRIEIAPEYAGPGGASGEGEVGQKLAEIATSITGR
jgi:uncharacterized coiled-coil protein SlyX